MSYTPLVRWRNFTLENLKSILEIYPDMVDGLSRSRAVDIIEQKLTGYKRTAYQFACQLGLECRENEFKTQNYLFSFDDDNLMKYLNFWFKVYVCPNPYIQSSEQPISIFKSLAEEILKSDQKQISFNNFCTKYFGEGKSSDILKNAIKAYGYPLVVNNGNIYLPSDKIDELSQILSKVNATLPMHNNMDEREFFDRFSYEQFCKYYDIPYSTNLLDNLNNNLFLERRDNYTVSKEKRLKGGMNVLLYGVPGAGKSYTIEHEYCDNESRMERLVFHPDYTYSDFIGQILPNVSEGIVSYRFTEGPFTRLLKKAYEHPGEEYYLIIEEINRGNAPAIFGEVFQMLDRDENGTSEYGISNSDIARVVYGDESRKVRIPSNMSIIGTMNTSDQNVFTLDTAFQRRWNMRMIENDMSKIDPKFANHKILDTEISWKQFNIAINNIIVRKNVRMTSSEDKRLGAYFIRKNDLQYNAAEKNKELSERERLKATRENSRFPEKVLKYLWDDAFKFSREDVFETSRYISLEDIVRKFRNSEGNERFAIFKEEIYNAIITENPDDEGV